MEQTVFLKIAPDTGNSEQAGRLLKKFPLLPEGDTSSPCLSLDADGLSFISGGKALKGDFTRMLHRVKNGLSKEFLVRTAKIKDASSPLTAIDATAGLGEDSFLLAAAGFEVKLFERNPVVYELLADALERAENDGALCRIVSRMELSFGDSIEAMQSLSAPPDVILLDPMFPERQKSALVKKKLQMIQQLETPCDDERELIFAAMYAKPKKLIVKRPPKGPYLAGIKPDYSTEGKAVRFDCFISPFDRIRKFDP